MIRWSPAQPVRARCPHERLSRLLAKALPSPLQIIQSGLRPWASANFVGARHHFQLALGTKEDAPMLDRSEEEPCNWTALAVQVQDQLADVQWPLFQHIVADLSAEVTECGRAIRLEILTVED